MLRNEQVLAQRRDGFVVRKLLASVVSFGRIRQDFDYERRVYEPVNAAYLFELSLATERGEVCITVRRRARHLYTHLRGKYTTAAVSELRLEEGDQVPFNFDVSLAAAAHAEDFAVPELEALF